MNQPPFSGDPGGRGDNGYGREESPKSGAYGEGSHNDSRYGSAAESYPPAGGQGNLGASMPQGGYGQWDNGAGSFASHPHDQGFDPWHGPSGHRPGDGGTYTAASPEGTSGAGGLGGVSSKTLGIIGGGLALVMVALLVLVFVVFGDAEERDRKNVIKAAERFVDTLSEGQSFSELNEQLCSRHQADERDVDDIDDGMADMGYDLPELFDFDEDDLQDLRDMSFTQRDVEFASDARREAMVYFDAADDQLTFRNVDGDWLVCDAVFDMSYTDIDDFSW